MINHKISKITNDQNIFGNRVEGNHSSPLTNRLNFEREAQREEFLKREKSLKGKNEKGCLKQV